MFGLAPQIELHGMGGTTSWINGRDVGHARGIAISLAGPFAGFALGALIYLVGHYGFPPHADSRAAFAYRQALFVNVGWGVFNLVPLLPLDGGNVLRGVLNVVTKGKGEKPARIVSIVVGVLILALAAYFRQLWLGALGAFFTWANLQAYRQVDTRVVDAPLAQAIEKAYIALEHHDGQQAIELLRPVLVPQTSPELRAIALRVYAYALLIEGNWAELLPMLEVSASLIGAEEMSRYAKTARELGRTEEGDRIAALVPGPRPANDFG
jgi:hypothetical protein